MRKLLLAFLATGVLPTVGWAQETPQFLSWEHSLTTRSSRSRHALAKVKIFNNWANGKHRLLAKYNVSGLGASDDFAGRTLGPAFSMPSFNPGRVASKLAYHHGTLGIVQDLSGDKIIAFSSEAGEHGEYFSEERKALMKRLRFDPWKKIAPELSREEVPRLSAAQRARLGREVRSALRPMLKDVFKTYFRALPKTRTFIVDGETMDARGYRMTTLLNAGGYNSNAQWVRVSFEWWLAPEIPADIVARRFLGQLISDYRELGGPTTSMWMNETLPLMWASMPQEFHQALSTLLPVAIGDAGEAAPLLALGGTPVYAAATVLQTRPKYGKCPDCGENHVPLPGQVEKDTLRIEAQLQQRSTRALAPSVFSAPAEYDQQPLEPLIKQWEEGVEMMQSAFEPETLLSAAPHARPEYSWRALKDYTRKASALMLHVR